MRKEQSGSSRSSRKVAERAFYVLDSYALFAYFEDEEGANIVADLIKRTAENVSLFLSLINFGEVAYITERERGPQQAVRLLEDIRLLPITLSRIDEERVIAAAHIKACYPVSYADAFAIALAEELGATAVTGDPEFKKVESMIPVLWLREV
ncbi:MAG: type II toxin-antitoxin system VapC family toxin [Anaerolineae bacterium]|nr:type II toxin-antitoxin system VapC family toxin [Anaerolineae bacterium]